MKNIKLTIVLLFLSFSFFAQKNDAILFTVNEEAVKVSEFKRVYEKNIELVDEEAKDIDKNLNLYINYKLKVQEAYALKLDTVKSYKKELKKYKDQLIAPYLSDDAYKKKQIKEAYNRTKEEVRASHILILYPKKGKRDTLGMLAKLNIAKQRIEKGESFIEVAKEVSEDPSAKQNGGDLGFFSAFKMVYPFEEAAYSTKLGEVSAPFKTRFGYHILKVTDKRLSKGQFEAAHILIKGVSDISKTKIEEVYKELQNGTSFKALAKKVSEDTGSAKNGGKLRKFGAGRMVAPFENAILNIKKEGDYSKPFKTRYGWHIVKLLKKHPIGTLEEMENSLTKKVMGSSRANLSKKAVIDRLNKEYTIVSNEVVLKEVLNGVKLDNATTDLVTINNKKIKTSYFNQYLKSKRKKVSPKVYKEFLDTEVLNYFKNDLENTNEDFKNTLNEYKDGLLLFDLMQNKIWKKAATDSVGLKKYFTENKKRYKAASLDKIKGKVTSDFQKHLEDSWIENLRNNNTIKVRKKTLKKLKLSYNQK